jgi:succinate dehydrogenase/fumarate reductase flavoprotein subunit
MIEITADVVIVGFGGAGAVAAIEAADAGAQVLVLEKRDEGGGSTRESGGSLRLVNDAEQAARHFMQLNQGTTPRDIVDSFITGVQEIPEWIERLGGEWQPRGLELSENEFPPVVVGGSAFPELEGADGVGARIQVVRDGGRVKAGEALWALLAENVAAREDITVHLGTGVQRLLTDPASGEITGVQAAGPDGDVTVLARRSVILSCGGFNYDPDLQLEFIGAKIPAMSPPGANSGDGIRMAQSVGASLWHMNAIAATIGYKFDDEPAGFWARLAHPGFLMIDQRCRRYVDEWSIERHAAGHVMLAVDLHEGRLLRTPSYLIMDSAVIETAPIVNLDTGQNRSLTWSADNSEEVARGWIKRADTLPELAAQLGLDPDALTASVERYNAGVRSGEDEFGRVPDRLAEVKTGPFYGIDVWPCLINTQGGPRKDVRGRVLDAYGEPIPRLFCAGELGSMWGRLYPGAGNVSECVALGRIAGREAAAVRAPAPARAPVAG